MKTIQGFVLIDVDVAALNNAGSDKTTALENAVMTKKIKRDGREYPYVSGQAWRYWWRETLLRKFDWKMSPVTREKKIAFTAADPLTYPDDDVFGYMRAAKKEVVDEKTGKKKSENITLTRVSPLKNSAFMAVSYNPIVQNWSSMTRQNGDAVPYGKDEYCSVMKGMFSIDVDQIGTFSMQNKTGFMNITQKMKDGALESGCNIIKDAYVVDTHNKPLEQVRMPKNVREKRIKDVVSALKYISGGAKSTTNFADVTPKLIVLTQFASGNHPFSHLAKEKLGKALFYVDAFKEVLNDFNDQFVGKIYIGRRKGFMDELDEELLQVNSERVVYGPVNNMIDTFVETINLE